MANKRQITLTMFEPKWAQGTEESDSTEISFKFTVSMQARPLDVVVQSALRDLSACHASGVTHLV